MIAQYLCVLTGVLIFLTVGCGYHGLAKENTDYSKTQTESEGNVKMDKSIRLIMEAGDIDQDSAEGTFDILLGLGASRLKNVMLVSNTRGIVLCAIDEDGETYYLGFGEFGYLEVIRRGSEDGEIIYAPEE